MKKDWHHGHLFVAISEYTVCLRGLLCPIKQQLLSSKPWHLQYIQTMTCMETYCMLSNCCVVNSAKINNVYYHGHHL